MNKKRNAIITIVFLSIILLSGGIFFILNYSVDDNSLTILEKKWLTDSANQIVDVQVYNNIPVYGYNGNGIIFDFLDYFTDKYAISFNKISYNIGDEIKDKEIAFKVLDSQEKLDEKDILLYDDHYVVLALEDQAQFELLDISKLGVLKINHSLIENYFGEDISFLEYNTVEDLILGLKKNEVSYIILPNMRYMSQILSEHLRIVYHVQDLKQKYVLRVMDDTIYSIMKKSYQEYLTKDYFDDYSKNYLDVYFASTKMSDVFKKSYNAKTYKYGYVINMPYENFINDQFVGTISNYLSDFEKQADVEIEVIRYDTIDDLKSAMVSEEIDFALGNFSYDSINMENVFTTGHVVDLDYLVLKQQTDDITLNSIKGLKGQKVSVVSGSRLYQLCKSEKIQTKNFANTDELLRGIDDQSIVLLDKQTYLYYKDSRLKDYKIIYEGVLDGYQFLMNGKNETFDALFDYYVSTIDYETLRYRYHTSALLDKDYTSIKIASFIVALIVFMIVTVLFLNRKNVTSPTISKEEILKYIDPMTSLKNRSYLNVNIYKWDDNVIFPQSVVVLDLNGIKEINDRLGREAGDEVIKKVASILINNQLENTDIIRSGGDEFLIYMVGYDEKSVALYMKNLLKEMKEIPHSSGVEAGYSMILDEVKSVDDAINEAIIMLTKNKDKRKL